MSFNVAMMMDEMKQTADENVFIVFCVLLSIQLATGVG